MSPRQDGEHWLAPGPRIGHLPRDRSAPAAITRDLRTVALVTHYSYRVGPVAAGMRKKALPTQPLGRVEHAKEGSCRSVLHVRTRAYFTEWAGEKVLLRVNFVGEANGRRSVLRQHVSIKPAMVMSSAISVLTCIRRNSADGFAGGQPPRTRALFGRQ